MGRVFESRQGRHLKPHTNVRLLDVRRMKSYSTALFVDFIHARTREREIHGSNFIDHQLDRLGKGPAYRSGSAQSLGMRGVSGMRTEIRHQFADEPFRIIRRHHHPAIRKIKNYGLPEISQISAVSSQLPTPIPARE